MKVIYEVSVKYGIGLNQWKARGNIAEDGLFWAGVYQELPKHYLISPNRM